MLIRPFLNILLILTTVLYCSPLLCQEIPENKKCNECGMKIDKDSRFSVIVIETGSDEYYYCDIGDMLYHYRKNKEIIKSLFVRDFITGKWIDGKKSFYIKNNEFKSPMRWNVAAFEDLHKAELYGKPLNLDDAIENIIQDKK